MMKYYELDEAERKLLEAVENGEFVSVKNLEKVKAEAKAIEEGLPYQTLASSILHKATSR